jgi:pimeloyl-ACP methyl ester carboxylesterase
VHFHYETVTAAGKRGRVLVAGDATCPTVIVILASQLVLAKSYRPTAAALARRGFRVRVVEMPGCGGGGRLRERWGMREYGNWVCAMLDELREDAPIVIGHSNSGAAAIVAARGCPQRFAALVLADSIGALPAKSLPHVLLGRALDGLIEWKLSLRALHHPIYNMLFHTRSLFRQINLAARTDVREIASQVHVATLIAWGARDHTMPPQCAARLKQAMPVSTLYVSESGSHDWIVDRAEEFANTVDAFAKDRLRLSASPAAAE